MYTPHDTHKHIKYPKFRLDKQTYYYRQPDKCILLAILKKKTSTTPFSLVFSLW